MKLSYIGTILIGALLIAIIAPLSQFLTIAAINVEIETASPFGWAIGLMFAIVLAAFPLRVLARTGKLSRPHLVILYCMLTIAIPVMNIGVVRQTIASVMPVFQEYLVAGTNTYRVAYNSADEDWFPKVPTRDGVAWMRADRLLSQLIDDDLVETRTAARRDIIRAISLAAEQIRRDISDDLDVEMLVEQITRLNVDDVEAIRIRFEGDAYSQQVMAKYGLDELLRAQAESSQATSTAVLQSLPTELEGIDEYAVSLLPDKLDDYSHSERMRVMADLAALPEAQREQLNATLERLQNETDQGKPLWRELATRVTQLTENDYRSLRDVLRDDYRLQIELMSDAEFQALRNSFVYRLTRAERTAAAQLGREFGEPDGNLLGFRDGLWPDASSKQQQQQASFSQNLAQVQNEIPWNIWMRPLLYRAFLLLVVFLLMMCLAEWLRRKWIERENLAFPLVEIADHLIRHDAELETTTDVAEPNRRRLGVDMLFLTGLAIGFVILAVEALGHYGFIGEGYVATFDVSGQVFTQGAFKEMNKVFLVISPIIIGIAFLISLEISFSVWMTFLIFSLCSMAARLGNIGQAGSSNMLGWGGAKSFPYAQEQMLGAVLAFTIFLLFKAMRKTSRGKVIDQYGQFVPQPIMVVGMIVLPLILIGLFWSMGFTGVGGTTLIVLFLLIIIAQVIAGARARAEAGMPTEPFTYEFTKLPILFGITGFTGGPTFARFATFVFLPVTMIFHSLAQMLENIELARRNHLRYAVIAVASIVAFLVAISVGMYSFMLMAYYVGGEAWGASDPHSQGLAYYNIAAYPLWVSHFLGEEGLNAFTRPHWARIWFVVIGFTVIATLAILRSRFLKFPLHPLGYILVLLTFVYTWTDPYLQGQGGPGSSSDTTWIWGSVFIAWMIKKLIIKYGGMNTYKRCKPLFIGLVVGSIVCIFSWNMLDLACSMIAANSEGDTHWFIKQFVDTYPFTPKFY